MSLNSNRKRVNVSHQDRIQFWSIFTTGLVGLFSLWLGITIQDDINTKNARETQKLARYQKAEALYPKFEEYIDTSDIVFYDLIGIASNTMLSSDKNKKVVDSVGAYYKRERSLFSEAMMNSVNYINGNQYYLGAIFGKKQQERICINGTSILFGLRLLENNKRLLYSMLSWQGKEQVMDNLSLELSNKIYRNNTLAFNEEIKDGLYNNYKLFHNNTNGYTGDSMAIVNNAIYQFIFLPYIDNFNVFTQELEPSSDVNNHFKLHFILLTICVIFGLLIFLFLLKRLFGIHPFDVDNASQNHE